MLVNYPQNSISRSKSKCSFISFSIVWFQIIGHGDHQEGWAGLIKSLVGWCMSIFICRLILFYYSVLFVSDYVFLVIFSWREHYTTELAPFQMCFGYWLHVQEMENHVSVRGELWSHGTWIWILFQNLHKHVIMCLSWDSLSSPTIDIN